MRPKTPNASEPMKAINIYSAPLLRGGDGKELLLQPGRDLKIAASGEASCLQTSPQALKRAARSGIQMPELWWKRMEGW